jgi:hypothetical protein
VVRFDLLTLYQIHLMQSPWIETALFWRYNRPMPTPFSHLAVAQRLLRDEAVSRSHRRLLQEETGAFLLGSVAADARVGAGVPRENTHFYSYAQDIVVSPWRVMLQQHPALWKPHSPAHRAFVAGYVGHLAMDEIWSIEMVSPHFVEREWGGRGFRFLMLHIILIYMDERDLALLEPWQPESLKTAAPFNWLTFISDHDLRAWQALIYDQIKPDGKSRTLEIFGDRILKSPAELRAILDSDVKMQSGLWDNIPKTVLTEVEAHMYDYARASLSEYFDASA